MALIETREEGLFCEAGGFHVDPWRPVARAVVTHAHSDHARLGCGGYLCSPTCVPLLRARLGAGINAERLPWGEARTIGGVRVTLFPAGHVLGSAQVRVEHVATGETWVVSGDYKLATDPTAEAFEPVRCHVFITESTFGLPVYRWPAAEVVAGEVNRWWAANAAAGVTTLIGAYSLGKAQRVLAMLDTATGPVFGHGAVMNMNAAYAAAGVKLPEVLHATRAAVKGANGRGLVVAPPGTLNSAWARGLGEVVTGAASGWMMVRGARRRGNTDRGFVLSDHADWAGLLSAIEATGAERVGVTHGFVGPLVRWLTERGKGAFAVATRFEGEGAAEVVDDEAVATRAGGTGLLGA